MGLYENLSPTPRQARATDLVGPHLAARTVDRRLMLIGSMLFVLMVAGALIQVDMTASRWAPGDYPVVDTSGHA